MQWALRESKKKGNTNWSKLSGNSFLHYLDKNFSCIVISLVAHVFQDKHI